MRHRRQYAGLQDSLPLAVFAGRAAGVALEKAGKLELVKESDQENPELQGSRDNNHPMNTMVGRMAFLLICLAPMVLTDRWAEMQMIARMARELFSQCAAAPA